MDLQFYHGNLTKKACEELLSKKGRNGCFLIRDSESIPGILCLCTAPGVKERVFHNLKDLVAFYEKPDQGLVINLRYPVNKRRETRKQRKCQNDTRNDYEGKKKRV
nr:PREDICTED: SH2 domain-containing protein 1B-like [Latimeria chalumnae]|eukprot:XP_014354096.1 PREDICTED: SH2 domain-containing protein 1B-like [Latimeria chalumnae]